jgi:transposase InsO family protein
MMTPGLQGSVDCLGLPNDLGDPSVVMPLPRLGMAAGGTEALGIDSLCRLAGVSRSGYYRSWQAHAPRVEETALRDALQRLALANRRYGYRRIGICLRQEGWVVNHKRVLRMTNEDNLLCLPVKPFVPVTTDSKHPWTIVSNLARGLVLTGIDQLWVADITYIHLAEAFVYLAVVIDAYSRRVVGWALDDHLRASLAIAALDMALAARNPRPDSLIHHSDRGVQYACNDYAARLAKRGIRASMSRVGNPYDNAKAERWMRTLKEDEVDGRTYRDAADAKEKIGVFIEQVYNRQRLHSALGYHSPADFEDTKIQRVVALAQPHAETTTCT